jgi:hypothetical protein
MKRLLKIQEQFCKHTLPPGHPTPPSLRQLNRRGLVVVFACRRLKGVSNNACYPELLFLKFQLLH